MSNTTRFRRSVAPVVVTAIALVGCGGDESAGGSIEEWCAFAAEAEVVDATFDTFGSGGDIEAGVAEIRGIVNRLGDIAPAEIKEDAQALEDGTTRLLDALAEADYNLLDADLAFMADEDLDARMEAASESLDDFTQRECGRAFGSADDSSDASSDDAEESDDDGFDPAAGTLRDQLMAQFESIGLTAEESSCIAENLDFNDPAIQNGDTTAMFAVFDECGIGLERLAEIGG